MNQSFDQSQTGNAVRYEIVITAEEARVGIRKTLSRQGTRLEVNIPAGVVTGSTVKLSNALQVTDGRPGDILVKIKVGDGKTVPAGATAGVIEISDGNFEHEVSKNSLPVVVDFWAPWCAPCRMIAPVTEKLAKEYQGQLKFCKLNVDENSRTASKYQVMSIPMLLFFKDGNVVDQIIGAVPESRLRSKVESVLQKR